MGRLLPAILACGLGLATAVAASAQAPAAVAPAPVDPTRLAAAKTLMSLMLPPEQRETMVRGMVEPVIANVRSSFESHPQLSGLLAGNPKARDLLLTFIDRQMEYSLTSTMEAMPALVEAMEAAYARRFSVEQINDIAGFYRTPTGQELIVAMPSLMASPEIAVVQKSMMNKALERVQVETVQLAQQLAALQSGTEKAKP